MKPFIFLDIDGVLATTHQFYTNPKKWPEYNRYRFDVKCVKVFNEILEKRDPVVVLSSDWKLNYSIDELNNIFQFNGVNCEISDITPSLWGSRFLSYQELEECRANEIIEYVNLHKITNFIAIDDLDLNEWLSENFICCPRANEGIKQSGVKDKILKLMQSIQNRSQTKN